MAKQARGFALMTREKRQEMASKGGTTAHDRGKAHEWTSEEAMIAGRKGGKVSARKKRDVGKESQEKI